MEKYFAVTEAQAAEYRKLRDLIGRMVKRYGLAAALELDPAQYPSYREAHEAAALAEAVRVAGPLPAEFAEVGSFKVPYERVALQAEAAKAIWLKERAAGTVPQPMYGTFLKERDDTPPLVLEISMEQAEDRLLGDFLEREADEMAKKAGEPMRIIPSEQPTVVLLIWRREAVGYATPPAFGRVFGKMALTIPQVKAIAKEWYDAGALKPLAEWTQANSVEFFQGIRDRDYPEVGNKTAEVNDASA